jgi:hypothetical protein
MIAISRVACEPSVRLRSARIWDRCSCSEVRVDEVLARVSLRVHMTEARCAAISGSEEGGGAGAREGRKAYMVEGAGRPVFWRAVSVSVRFCGER